VNRLTVASFSGDDGMVAINGNDASVVSSLAFSSGKLDVTSAKLIVNGGGGAPAVRAHLAAGFNNGAWDGPGIVTSDPLAVSQIVGLAVAMAGELNVTSFGNVNVTASDTLVFRAYAGDCDLNGRVDGDDYFMVDTNFETAEAQNITWRNGDLNYDGVIDADDYTVIDASYLGQGDPILFSAGGPSAGVAAVPEPAGFAILCVAAKAFVRRRRRR
jgi:hypothetical protein